MDERELHYRRAIALLEAYLGEVTPAEIRNVRSHADAEAYADWVGRILASVHRGAPLPIPDLGGHVFP